MELAKLWRTDRVARRLDAALLVSDRQITLEVNGNGDVIEPFDDVMGIGSGSLQAVCAARALMEFEHIPLEEIARKAMKIAADSCVYTNEHWTIEKVSVNFRGGGGAFVSVGVAHVYKSLTVLVDAFTPAHALDRGRKAEGEGTSPWPQGEIQPGQGRACGGGGRFRIRLGFR